MQYDEYQSKNTVQKQSLDEEFMGYHTTLMANFKAYLPHIKKIFCNYRSICENKELLKHLGWDNSKNNTLVIALFDNGKVTNIKHRTKANFGGKWISASAKNGAKTTPLYQKNDKDYLVLVEGEKDALNLASQGVNVATLGGVANSYEHYKYLYNGISTVYIWYDFDKAGYDATIARANELYSFGIKQVYYIDYRDIVQKGNLYEKFDVSDYLSLYPLIDESDFFSQVIRKATFMPLSKPDFIQSINTIDFITNKNLFTKKQKINKQTIKQFTHKLYNEMDNLQTKLLKWADTKQVDTQYFISILSEFFSDEVLPKNYANMLTNLFSLDNEIRFFGTEKRVNVARHIYTEAKRIGCELKSDNNSLFFYNGIYYEVWKIEDFRECYLNHLYKKCTDLVDSVAVTNLYITMLDIVPKLSKEKTILINLQNCVLDPISNKVYNHSSSFDFTYCLPFDYNPKAICELFTHYLSTSLPDKNIQNIVLEYIGYCMLPTYKHQKFMVLTGKGSNGKSVLMEIMEAFFTRDSVGLVDSFEGSDLEGIISKSVNFSKDRNLKTLTYKEIDTIKKISDGSSFDVSPKFRNPITIDNPPKLIISTNNLSSSTEYSILRRMLIIPFDTVFDDTKHKKIKDLDKKIISSELSGVFNLVLQALQNLIKNDSFTKSKTIDEFNENHLLDSNSVYRFISECIEIVKNDNDKLYAPAHIQVQDMYKRYISFCEEEGVKPKSKINFGKDIKEYLKIESKTKTIDNKVFRVYENIKYKM